jgi:hypothetical protein
LPALVLLVLLSSLCGSLRFTLLLFGGALLRGLLLRTLALLLTRLLLLFACLALRVATSLLFGATLVALPLIALIALIRLLSFLAAFLPTSAAALCAGDVRAADKQS